MEATVRPVWTDEPALASRGKCGLCRGTYAGEKSIDLCAVCVSFAVDLAHTDAAGLVSFVPEHRRPMLRAIIESAGREQLERAAAAFLSAQQQGPTTDPEKLGAAEAERIPDWVYTGGRP